MTDAAARPNVLVLDDDPLVRRTMCRFLELYGYAGLEAETLDQTLELLKTTTVSAVILDIRLSGRQSGLDLLAPLRSRPETANVPVLVMTGGVVDEREERLITRHRAHLFFKPEGFDTMLSFLDHISGRGRPF